LISDLVNSGPEEFVRVEIPNTLIRSGTFLGANEDSTRTLAEIEKKIARATVLPRNHGENGRNYVPI